MTEQPPTTAPAAEPVAESIAEPTTTTSGDAVDTAMADADADADADDKSQKVSLADLCAKAAALYAHKNYEEASEAYAQAAELQAEINGETDPENAEVLFLYGRSLFKVGQGKSDVLGGKAPGPEKKKKMAGKGEAGAKTEAEEVTQEGVGIVAEKKEGEKDAEDAMKGKKAMFKFEGDENLDEQEEEAEGEEGEGEGEAEAEEEEDDLAAAFEVLDLSRVMFTKKLAAAEEAKGKEKGKEADSGDDEMTRHIKERLGDAHDLLAEISLENERYPNAIEDCREALRYKKELHPEESEIRAEAHYKLSLALEFASVTTTAEDGQVEQQKAVDQTLRDEAADQLEAAIASTRLKLQGKEVELATMASPEDNDLTRGQIADVKEIIADMEQRLVDLRKPPIDVNAALGGANPLGGILGAQLGESAAETEARVEEARKTATDLSGLVRKKNKAAEEAAAPAVNGKRKAEEDVDSVASESKKAKVEEDGEAGGAAAAAAEAK